jgi:hypothetical protein
VMHGFEQVVVGEAGASRSPRGPSAPRVDLMRASDDHRGAPSGLPLWIMQRPHW